MTYELKTRQICLFFIAFMPITKFFMLPSIATGIAGEDMWISEAFCLLADFLTVVALIFACKDAKTDFFGLLKENFGNVVAKIIYGFYFMFFLLKGILPVLEQKDYVELTLYITSPNSIYFLSFFLAAIYLSTKKLRAIGRMSDVMWIITVSGFTLLMALSVSGSDFAAILPMFAHGGKKILCGSYVSSGWYGSGAYLLFFLGEFDYGKKDGLKIALSYLISSLMILLFMIVFYATFTSIAYRQRFAMTEITKYTTVINNTGRFDYFGIMLLLLSGITAVSLPIFFASKILNRILDVKRQWITPFIVSVLLSLPITLLSQFDATIEKLILRYCSAYFIIFGNVLPPFTLLLKKNLKRREVLYETN